MVDPSGCVGRSNVWGLGGKHTPKVPKFGVSGPILANGKKGDPTGSHVGGKHIAKVPIFGVFGPILANGKKVDPTGDMRGKYTSKVPNFGFF